MPFSPSNSYSASIMESKDRRAMHAARQHALHPNDRRKSKSARAPKSGGGSRPGSHVSNIDVSDEYIDYTTAPQYMLAGPYPDCPCCLGGDDDASSMNAPRNTQVSLSDIIQIKPGRKKKGPEADFEMVPRPSEVLVLDEDQEELYAEWEDVSMGALRGESNVARLPVSYAAALSRR